MKIDDSLVDWVRLARSLPVGAVAFSVLRRIYNTPKQMLSALSRMLKKSPSYFNKSVCSSERALKEVKAVEDFGAEIITFQDNDYPRLLRHIRCPPPLLTVIGDAKLFFGKVVAIVGSRNASINSLRFAAKLSMDLADAGYTIVSGLAKGIDTVVHGVVDADKPTVAVMASGIDIVYPSENKELYKKIAKGGVVTTESAFGTAPKGYLFPQRNRIISGLSLGIVVVEASSTSGSLITAKFALAQGREVFAVPGFPMDPRYGGNSYLLKGGATLVESAEDVIYSLDRSTLNDENGDGFLFETGGFSAVSGMMVDIDEKRRENAKNRILELLDSSPVELESIMDVLVSQEGFDEILIMESVLELEISDKIERHPGNKLSLIFAD